MVADGNSEVGKCQTDSHDVDLVPGAFEVSPSLVLQLHQLNQSIPQLSYEERQNRKWRTEESVVQEDDEELKQEEAVFKYEEPERALPSFLNVNLEQFGLKD